MKSSSIAWSPFSTGTNIHSKLGTRLVMSKAGDRRAGGNPVATDRPSLCTTHHTLRWDLGRTKRVNTCTLFRASTCGTETTKQREYMKTQCARWYPCNTLFSCAAHLKPSLQYFIISCIFFRKRSFLHTDLLPSTRCCTCQLVRLFFSFSKKNRALGFSIKVPSRLFLATRRYVCIYVCMFVSLLIIALDLHCQFPVILRPRFCVAQKPSDLGADLRCSYIAMSDHMAMQLSKL